MQLLQGIFQILNADCISQMIKNKIAEHQTNSHKQDAGSHKGHPGTAPFLADPDPQNDRCSPEYERVYDQRRCSGQPAAGDAQQCTRTPGGPAFIACLIHFIHSITSVFIL
jgi:hypothetical protein